MDGRPGESPAALRQAPPVRVDAALGSGLAIEHLRARLVELAERPDPEVRLAEVRQHTRTTGGSVDAQRILAHRDADRQ